jgi:hypothetical protein
MTPSRGRSFVSSPKNPVQYHGTASGFEKLPRRSSNHSPTRPASSISCFLPHVQHGRFPRVFLLELSPFLLSHSLSLLPVSTEWTSKFGFGPAIFKITSRPSSRERVVVKSLVVLGFIWNLVYWTSTPKYVSICKCGAFFQCRSCIIFKCSYYYIYNCLFTKLLVLLMGFI